MKKILPPLVLFIIAVLFRSYGVIHRENLTWDEVELWYQALSDFRGPYMPPLAPKLTLFGFLVSGSTSYFAYHLILIFYASLAIPLYYYIAKQFFSEKTSLISTVLLIFSSISVYYSEEARFYALVQPCAALILLSLTLAIKKQSWRHWLFVTLALFLALQTHMIFTHILIALGLLWILLIFSKSNISHTRYILSILLGSITGLSWLVFRTVPAELNQGFFSKGILSFIHGVLSGFSTRIYSGFDVPPELFSLIPAAILLIIGSIIFIRKKQPETFMIVSLLFTPILILFFTLGEKSMWPWYRYLVHLIPGYLILVTAGLKFLYESKRLKNLALLSYALLIAPGLFYHFGNSHPTNISVSVAAKEFKKIPNNISGVILPEVNWGFGDESERPPVFFLNSIKTDLPVYKMAYLGFQSVKLIDSKLRLTKIPEINRGETVQVTPGDYILYPYNFVQPDGLYGRNKPSCEYLANFLPNLTVTKVASDLKLLDVCRIS